MESLHAIKDKSRTTKTPGIRRAKHTTHCPINGYPIFCDYALKYTPQEQVIAVAFTMKHQLKNCFHDFELVGMIT